MHYSIHTSYTTKAIFQARLPRTVLRVSSTSIPLARSVLKTTTSEQALCQGRREVVYQTTHFLDHPNASRRSERIHSAHASSGFYKTHVPLIHMALRIGRQHEPCSQEGPHEDGRPLSHQTPHRVLAVLQRLESIGPSHIHIHQRVMDRSMLKIISLRPLGTS